ncbi:class I SAM-dependent methyltransferase [Heliophilum fasciatum]|uniref:Precorrin-6B methylase 2 n=1 Tax=Heliophilum fasciatum TaxID=35700 RepID=A0A4R2RMA2_9FIRM|nr:class I SAM-dependent methyltransferase [Heliophilum fasciatum]MCW2278991.1 precorrin-6B methylase 2 [Heliophilum fasciatum]TCP64058.1 precorrin-6B methylase 2 [Heliophilum fasciatum]
MQCCVCKNEMQVGLEPWHWQCNVCRYEATSFEPAINQKIMHTKINEIEREDGLKELREQNFRILIELINQHLPSGGKRRLLDVGAAHGWFVKMAMTQFDAVGIEPDKGVCRKTKESGVPIIEGYFPEVLNKNDRFDVIVFNDVFEHLSDVSGILRACKDHLTNTGILVINLPSNEGFFYKLSKFFKRAGFSSFFERMWQKGLPSPHLHYFNTGNIISLVEQHSFRQVNVNSLPAIHIKGLYNRIKFTGQKNNLLVFLIWIAVVIAMPFITMFKSDNTVVLFKIDS